MTGSTEKSVHEWARQALFFVGLSWQKNRTEMSTVFQVSRLLALRWCNSHGVPKAQLIESGTEKSHWLGAYTIYGDDPFLLDVFSKYTSLESDDILGAENIIKEYFPAISIPRCASCQSRFWLEQVDDEFYCQECRDILRPGNNKKAGFVYVFGSNDTGYYKIGSGTKPVSRMRDYELSKLPFPVEMIHTIPVDNKLRAEAELHKAFKSRRVNGEWFTLSQDELHQITGLKGYQAGHWLR